MSDRKAGEGVGIAPSSNYVPTPIERLTNHTVEQRILATQLASQALLERIETLIAMVVDNTRPAGTSAIVKGKRK